jgi:hypothetical protein
MNVLLWILQVLLALAFLGSGGLKIVRSRQALKLNGLAWVDDFSAATVKGIGVLEVLGALGLVLPMLLDVAPVLTPIAAVGLALVMAGAVVVHARRHERTALPPPAVLGVLALLVAILRL